MFTARARGRHAPSGPLISYRNSQAATTHIAVESVTQGVRHGKTCTVLTKHAKGNPRHCTRYMIVTTLTHADHAGLNTIHFSGRVNGRVLPAGTYRLTLTARNGGGQVSHTITATFSIIG